MPGPVLGRSWCRDRRGAAAPLVALCMMALLAAAAVSVDLGQVFLASRRLQGLADLAAMSAAQAMGGGSDDASAVAAANAAATATVAANAWSPGPVQTALQPGVYTPDPTQAAARRFVPGSVAPNAAQVTLSASVNLFFAGIVTGRSTLPLSRTATAGEAQLAAFSIGSGLVSLNGGIANALLSALTGSQVSLSAVDYQSLLSAKVDLLDYMPALATRAHLTGASYDSLLSGQVSTPVALQSLSDALTVEGQIQAAAVVGRLATAAAGVGPVQLSGLFDLGPYGVQDHASSAGGAAVSLQALSLVDALLTAANGQRQLALDLGAAVPGVLDVKAWLAIGQRPSHSPWLTVAQGRGVVVSTAQARLYLQASVAPGALSALGAVSVNLPVFLEAASAQAQLSALQCPADPAAQSVTLSASPSLGTLAVAQASSAALADFTTPVPLSPADLLDLGAVRFILYGKVTLGGGSGGWQSVRFAQADIAADTVKSVYADNVAQATLASLLGNTAVQVQGPLGSLGVAGLATTAPALQALLQPVGASLDGVLAQLEGLTGVRLGEADLWVDGLRCRGAALVG